MENTSIYKININDISHTELAVAYSHMDLSRRKKCDAFKREADRRLCIAADMLLRQAIALETGADAESLHFSVAENGKPYIDGNDIHFSISHSGDMAAVALCRSAPVGIDIEKIAPVKARIADRVFCDKEKSFVFENKLYADGEIDDPVVLERFFRVWTYKEAYVKMTGEGIDDNIKNVVYDAGKCFSQASDGYCITVITK